MRKNEMIRVDVGSAGREYFYEQLAFETTPIGLVSESKPDIVDTFAFLPGELSRKAAASFESSLGLNLARTLPSLVNFVQDYLTGDPDHACVMENFDVSKDELESEDYKYKSRILFRGSVPFHVAVHGDHLEQITHAFVESETIRYHFGLLTTGGAYLGRLPQVGTELQDLELLVHEARYLITSAWDTEAYLVGRLRSN